MDWQAYEVPVTGKAPIPLHKTYSQSQFMAGYQNIYGNQVPKKVVQIGEYGRLNPDVDFD